MAPCTHPGMKRLFASLLIALEPMLYTIHCCVLLIRLQHICRLLLYSFQRLPSPCTIEDHCCNRTYIQAAHRKSQIRGERKGASWLLRLAPNMKESRHELEKYFGEYSSTTLSTREKQNNTISCVDLIRQSSIPGRW